MGYRSQAEALQIGFAQRLGIELEPGELTAWEQARTAELRETKYSTPAWTNLPAKRGQDEDTDPA